MAIIDNINLIKNLVIFNETPGDFYFVEIIKRRKENPDMTSGERIVRDFTIASEKEWELLIPKICALCIEHNARAYIRLNRRNFYKIGHRMINFINAIIESKDIQQIASISSVFYKMAGKFHSESNKTWIIDLDDDDVNLYDHIYKQLVLLYELYYNKSWKITKIPTLNGVHMIVSPFNIHMFQKNNPTINLKFHKDNPTILYYNNNHE